MAGFTAAICCDGRGTTGRVGIGGFGMVEAEGRAGGVAGGRAAGVAGGFAIAGALGFAIAGALGLAIGAPAGFGGALGGFVRGFAIACGGAAASGARTMRLDSWIIVGGVSV